MRTCHEVNNEVRSRFFQEAICRRKVGYSSSYQSHYNPPPSLQAQNFELRCNLDSSLDKYRVRGIQAARKWDQWDPVVTFRRASSFGRGDIRRKRMVIELQFGAQISLSENERVIKNVFEQPERFVGFQLLVVKFLPMPEPWTVADKTRIGLKVRNILEPKLGPAVHYEENGDDCGCIEFHPWSLMGSQSHILEPVWFIKQAVWDIDEQESLKDVDDEW